MLVLDDTRSFHTFVNVDVEPVPSLLRGFSAPVVLHDGLEDADLLVLLAHDEDPFNRWEAGQRLALKRLCAAAREGGEPLLDDAFLGAMRDVLRNPALDAAFKDLVLQPPSEGYIAEQLPAVDPQAVHTAREAMKLTLARELRDDWQARVGAAPDAGGGYSPDPLSSGKRALANLALSMLVLDAAQRGDTVWPGKAYQRVKDAANMTDRLGALAALVDAHAELATPALERFHSMFRHEALVVDKWFALQARAPERNGRVFARAKALLQHPDFSLKNPNRARSLIFTLTHAQPRRVPPRRRRRLRVLVRARARARCDQSADRGAAGSRDGPLEPSRRALPQRGARVDLARGRAHRAVRRRAERSSRAPSQT